jgi:hypothetical protein
MIRLPPSCRPCPLLRAAALGPLSWAELHKLAAMAAGVSEALRERGVVEPGASILGEVAIAIFHISFERRVAQSGEPDPTELIRALLAELRALTAEEPLTSAAD